MSHYLNLKVALSMIKTEVSVGEFVDKLTILKIKSERILAVEKLVHIRTELSLLTQLWNESEYSQRDITEEMSKLKSINETLWVIEDDIREKEAANSFDEEFIRLARAVYVTNDQRAEIKKSINIKVGSRLIEEKSYKDYR